MESDCSSLDLPLLNINLVSAKHDGDVLAHALQIPMPVGNVLVRNFRRDIEHDQTTLALNIVSISQSTKLLLSGGVPNVEANGTEVGVESKGVDFNTERCDVLLFEFSSQMSFDESGLSSSSITDCLVEKDMSGGMKSRFEE